MKKLLVVLAVAFAVSFVAAGAALAAGVDGTAHDLAGGGATINELCVYCHTPHGSDPAQTAPLWSHTTATNGGYTPYDSPTMNATMTATLSTVSLACMSCHDGTVAVGSIAYGSFSPVDATGTHPGVAGAANFGTDLSNDHPVSIAVDAGDANIEAPATIVTTGGLPLFGAGTNIMECGTCHNVHDNATATPFLRKSNANSAICTTCHLNH